jgi:hypothetical protein
LRPIPDVAERRHSKIAPFAEDFAKQLANHFSDVKHGMTEGGLADAIITRLADQLTARSAACLKILRKA